ncbi:MAG: cyclic nucleotide-binding domain-containing protein [Burkholderiales bacterium]|nr:cyclic nucleotide-binding domain-containing protein [Burkholderiales bacterium]
MTTYQAILTRLGVRTTGYRPKFLATDLSLGAINGIDYVLWGYTFSSMIFTGALSGYLPVAVAVLMVSSTIIAVVVATTSDFPVNVAGLAEQAVAILATVAILMNGRMGEFAGVDAAAATMFVIMALTTLLFGVCLHLAAKFNLSLIIQLMPFPVVCGFLAGTGWLFFSAAITTMTDAEVEFAHLSRLFALDSLVHWMPALACGLAITVLMKVKDHYLTLPASLLACFAGFYAFAYWQGMPLDALRDGGWVFKLEHAAGVKGLADLDFAGVNLSFIVSVLPEIATIVLICLLSASFAFSALELGSGGSLDLRHELSSHGSANVVSGLGFGLPGITDVAYSVMYHRMGASSRLPALMTGGFCLLAAFLGGSAVEYLPKLLVGALVFLAAIHLIHDWLIAACRQMNRADALTVWLIFGVIVVVGFIPGILLGIILTSLMFIVRYSKIEVVGSSFSLDKMSSSVDRSSREIALIREFGKAVSVFNLRGFLFFGSANVFFERIKATCQQETGHSYFIFNFRRVLGIDSTAAQVFVKLINFLDSKGITPIFCGMNHTVSEAFRVSKVFGEFEPLVLDDLDLALTWAEEKLLADRKQETGPSGIREILAEILGDSEKAERMSGIMRRLSLDKGDYLFHKGDSETSLYVIESGTIEVRLEQPDGTATRLREFRKGTVVGEMAAYSDRKTRSASALAVEKSVVYGLAPGSVKALGDRAQEYEVILHEFVARLLSARLLFMNSRTEADL